MNRVKYHWEDSESEIADWLTDHPDIDVISMCADHAGYFYVFYREKSVSKNEE